MKKIVLPILFVCFTFIICIKGKGQTDSTYSIVVAGHAYGAHAGSNIGLHPPFLEKLKQNIDSTVTHLFLTGDIVNYSTTESWQQVENELSEFDITSCYVMGNHDDNPVGHAIFQEKYGSAWYYFSFGNELFIVLNSTESDRSISLEQLDFLENVLINTDSNWSRVFVFFHEVIWNNHEKYRLVRSNSRSRYDQMIGHSNFWEEVFPMLASYTDKEFYFFAGDVGGNTDAIAASYDKWENATLISSGMGEVTDENYLKADILPDTVLFTLIPLDEDVKMYPIQWYNVPEMPTGMQGPEIINPLQTEVKYGIQPVFNATNYRWNLSEGINGASDSASIVVNFDENFYSGEISVSAINYGFGESDPVFLAIKSDDQTSVIENRIREELTVVQYEQYIQIQFRSENADKVYLKLYNAFGRSFLTDEFIVTPGLNTKLIEKNFRLENFLILELTFGNRRITQKIIAF